MKMLKYKIKTLNIIFGLMFIFTLAIGAYIGVHAGSYSGSVFGKASYRGYFTNTLDYNGTVVLPPKGTSGDAIPGYIDTVDELMSLLINYNDHGSTQEKTGSAFIANTMLNLNGPGRGKVVSDADWGLLRDYLESHKIVWNKNVDNTINSYYQGGGDDAFYAKHRDEPGITIYNDDGTIGYLLLRRCANPMGRYRPNQDNDVPHYELVPSVESTAPLIIEAGASFDIMPKINNRGPTVSEDTQWKLTKTIIQPGDTISNPNGGNSETEPCTYFGYVSSCSVVDKAELNSSGDGSIFGVTTTSLSIYGETDTNLPAGTDICYALSVQPRAYSASGVEDSRWSHSATACVVIGKKPKVQIWGGDLMVGGSVTTSSSVKNIGGIDRTFGSWAEYGILATGIIKGMASGSAFAGPGLANPTVCKYSTLSFTNAGSSTSCEANQSAGAVIGGYVSTRSLPDVAASFPIISTTPNVAANLSGLPSGTYTASGNVSISGGNIEKSQYIVINAPSATITITGNINYTNGTLQKLSDIPQVIIIANKIVINGGVTNVNAWLIAKNSSNTGEIYTCEILGDTVDKCNQPLVVNGPVMTNKLYLRRTGGSGAGAASGDPAEVFNLRPDAYLWAFSRAATNGRIRTVYTTELPPRL